MWLPRILHPLPGILHAIRLGLPVLLRAIWAQPSLLFRPQKMHNIFMAGFWVVVGPELAEGAAPVKERLITPFAKGVVLEIGAGHGHTLKYFDREKVTRYIAVEPNEDMYAGLRKNMAETGFSEADGTALILPFGAHEVDKIAGAVGEHQVDTLISFLTFCSVPNPKQNIPKLCTTLLKRPGGTLLMYEHVLSPVWSTRIYQRLWTPIQAFVWNGCRMDQDTPRWVEQVPWTEKDVRIEHGMPKWHLFLRVGGHYVL